MGKRVSKPMFFFDKQTKSSQNIVTPYRVIISVVVAFDGL